MIEERINEGKLRVDKEGNVRAAQAYIRPTSKYTTTEDDKNSFLDGFTESLNFLVKRNSTSGDNDTIKHKSALSSNRTSRVASVVQLASKELGKIWI